ncbi:polysaccharide pyruvyl transferase family protein [Parabacteroides sp.]
MKIGILTFHWATNYGAVLQCYALQSYLESMGHDVKVINYKPHQYDDNLYNFLRFRKFLNLEEYFSNRKKESVLCEFRCEYLHQTERVYNCKDIALLASQFDAIISGSDQVCNPSFLMSGEGRGVVSPAYFLGFPFEGKRIGYALSFGCVEYPEVARSVAAKFIKNFDVITVREKTGVKIVKSIGRGDAIVVPDPTLLMEPQFYHQLANECKTSEYKSYVYSYFIRHIAERKQLINNYLKGKYILWNNEDEDYTMQGWLSKIKHAEFIVTDSFHCVVMCLKLHKPFVVITEKKGNVGMNDRLYTLLCNIEMLDHIVYKEHISQITTLLDKIIDWCIIDNGIIERTKSLVDLLK